MCSACLSSSEAIHPTCVLSKAAPALSLHIATLPPDQIAPSQVEVRRRTTEEQIERIPASLEVLFHMHFSSSSPGMPLCLTGVNVLFICYQIVINPLWKGIKTNKRLLPIKQSMMAKNPVVKTMKMVGSAKLKDKD